MDIELGAGGLRLEREGPIAWCVIDRPAVRNALTPAMYYGIKRAVWLVNTEPDLAALIITGTGDVFAPGGDLGGRSEPGDSFPETVGYDSAAKPGAASSSSSGSMPSSSSSVCWCCSPSGGSTSAPSGIVCAFYQLTKRLVVSVAVAPGDVAADHRVLLFV